MSLPWEAFSSYEDERQMADKDVFREKRCIGTKYARLIRKDIIYKEHMFNAKHIYLNFLF